ncbi:MAG: transposase [Alphaproteobacteria bacterium]|jgi:putative transposase
MSRPLRIEYPGAVYHVTARANGRQQLFTSIEDGSYFVQLLAREISQHKWLCHAYCLLEDHYHLVIETPEANLGRGMGRLNMAYSQWFGREHDQRGHLFHGRYKSIVLQKERHLLEVCRHVVLNPVRVQAVNCADHWKWSSYRPIAFEESEPTWLHRNWLLNHLASDSGDPAGSWRAYIEKGVHAASPWDDLRAGHYLGDEAFLTDITDRIRQLPLDQVPAKTTNPARPTAEKVLQTIAAASGASQDILLDRKAAPEAFQAAVYLLRRASNMPLREVAVLADVSQGRVSQIQRKIEDNGGISASFPWGKDLTGLL